ncbi:FecR family protein [Gracilimonas amylolytica]|uniref:FecR family protein n=1 Tax=Gracilimonas amylolytica TaxID=1749045 RepID=UPI000CD973F4|nr:FecR family protein [Gracilimonas amylolytica]
MNIHDNNGPDDKDRHSLPEDLNNDLEAYKRSEDDKISLTDSEVENALGNVLGQIEDVEQDKAEPTSGFSFNWKLMAIAATISFVGMLFILSIPISVQVPNGETATVSLPDGTEITLNSGSELTYSRFYNYLGRNVTLTGEGYFDVYSDPEDPFTVTTANSVVKVLGTEFNLTDWGVSSGPKAKLAVAEGSVEFTELKENRSLVLNQNETAVITESSEITSASAELDNILAWLSNNIAFQNDNLNDAFNLLERRFDIQIQRDQDLALQSENITAFYHQPNDPESIIQDICTIKGLNYQKIHNGYRISAN